MIVGDATGVTGVDGKVYAALPADVLPPRAIAHLAGTAVAILSNDGKSVYVASAPDDGSAWSCIALGGLEGQSLIPLAPFRLAVGCRSSGGTSGMLSHISLIDAVEPSVESFGLPSTPSPVSAIAPLDISDIALALHNGTIAAWAPTDPSCVRLNAVPNVIRAHFLWWDPTLVSTATNPASLYGLGQVVKAGGDPVLARFALGTSGDIVNTAEVPAHLQDLLRVEMDAKVYGRHPHAGCLVSRGGTKDTVVFPRSSESTAIPFLALTADATSAAPPSQGVVMAAVSGAEMPDPCPICFDDITLGSGDAVAPDCGHAVHRDCLLQCLDRAESYIPHGHRIIFSMAACPRGCRRLVRHPCYEGSARILDRYAKVIEDVKARAAHDYPGHAADEVMGGYLHYVCGTCGDPYWGGSKDCAAMMSGEVDVEPSALRCIPCSHKAAACPQHGGEWLFHKCSYCCNVASDFSLGRLWLCEACVAEKRKAPVWAPGSDNEARGCVGAAECPLGGQHEASNADPTGCLLCYLAQDRIEQRKLRQPPADPQPS
jgi:hypothetical protein